MNNTKIEWTDCTWNPVSGCLHGCPYCYARAIYHRFGRDFQPMFHPSRLVSPLKMRKPKRIFVGSVTDLFGDWVPIEWIGAVFNIVRQCPQHIFQFLTKNPKRYTEFDFPHNAWLGATATNQQQFDSAITILQHKKGIRFLSCEPLLQQIDSTDIPLDWLIIGAQTGSRPFQPPRDWVLSLTIQGRASGCAIFYKANLFCYENAPQEFPRTA